MAPIRSLPRLRSLAALVGAAIALSGLAPAVIASEGDPSIVKRYIVVFNGEYALDGSYALGGGYALVGQAGTYALDQGYALGRNYALYALNDVYALADDYALTADENAQDAYALFGEYALDSGYALDAGYALGSGYALASETATYALDESYALTGDSAGYALDESYALADSYALGDNYALARDYALYALTTAGGVMTADLSRQAGIMVVDSKNAAFAETLARYALVADVAQDHGWKQFPTLAEAVANGQLTMVTPTGALPGAESDPLESMQWSMAQIRTAQARAVQAGSPKVDVGIVDTGIDGNHLDFIANGSSNVDCQRGADFTAQGPGIGSPFACVDNNFHGTHVAGIVAARANGHGVVGVAPNVTLVPIKVCDADGHCYFSDALEGITYAGDLALDVINMSFFVDDDEFQQSTEFKCLSDPVQRVFRTAIERALKYARKEGVTLVAAAGNSDANFDAAERGCEVVPAQSDGVVTVAALGPSSEKAWYSNWGSDIDVAAPGGNDQLVGAGDCALNVLSTLPGNLWGCIEGTSMAAPHATGVAALIVSQFGKADKLGRLSMSPGSVADRLENSAIDIGIKRGDVCFGEGRIDALRAVNNWNPDTYDSSAPFCPEYNE
jgi:subtilisin family serine protease